MVGVLEAAENDSLHGLANDAQKVYRAPALGVCIHGLIRFGDRNDAGEVPGLRVAATAEDPCEYVAQRGGKDTMDDLK